LLDEYGLTEADIRNKIATRLGNSWIDGRAYDTEYLVHESVLRSAAEFPCAADAEALEFCREIVEVMATAHGLIRDDAVAALNRYWPDPWRRGPAWSTQDGTERRTRGTLGDVAKRKPVVQDRTDQANGADNSLSLPLRKG
jgi:hypothetical protein